jgi:hypothetical protein
MKKESAANVKSNNVRIRSAILDLRLTEKTLKLNLKLKENRLKN